MNRCKCCNEVLTDYDLVRATERELEADQVVCQECLTAGGNAEPLQEYIE
jgi:hypothetical protein